MDQKINKKNFNGITISWHLSKQVRVLACPMYSISDAFVRVRRTNKKIK